MLELLERMGLETSKNYVRRNFQVTVMEDRKKIDLWITIMEGKKN